MLNRNLRADKTLAARAAEGARVLLHAEKDCLERFIVTTILRRIQ